MDTIDMKPDAPSEVRGEFQPIATNLPGFMISELMPRIGSIADRLTFIRSLVGSTGRHAWSRLEEIILRCVACSCAAPSHTPWKILSILTADTASCWSRGR